MKRTPITRRPSPRKRAFDAEYAAILPSILARGCEFRRYVRAAPLGTHLEPVPMDCHGRELGHHARGRRIHEANAPQYLRCLCDFHHTYVHAHPRWAREVGLMISRTA